VNIVIIERLDLTAEEFYEVTGWELKPEGACRDDRCIPLDMPSPAPGERIDVVAVAGQLGLPIAKDDNHGIWAIGPESGGRVLESATFPDVILQDFDGNDIDLGMLLGRKVVLIAWASW
jgi:hypothetical protein